MKARDINTRSVSSRLNVEICPALRASIKFQTSHSPNLRSILNSESALYYSLESFRLLARNHLSYSFSRSSCTGQAQEFENIPLLTSYISWRPPAFLCLDLTTRLQKRLRMRTRRHSLPRYKITSTKCQEKDITIGLQRWGQHLFQAAPTIIMLQILYLLLLNGKAFPVVV